MSTWSYLQLSLLVWGFIAATGVGVVIHTVGERHRRRVFAHHTATALSLVADCWPNRDIDDEAVRCGTCDVLYVPDRVCPLRDGGRS